jgi:hypothetical protein
VDTTSLTVWVALKEPRPATLALHEQGSTTVIRTAALTPTAIASCA